MWNYNRKYSTINGCPNWYSIGLHRFWRRKVLVTTYEMLATVLTILITKIHLFTWPSGTNIQKMSPWSKFSHQHHINIWQKMIPTSTNCHSHRSSLTPILWKTDFGQSWESDWPTFVRFLVINPVLMDSRTVFNKIHCL